MVPVRPLLALLLVSATLQQRVKLRGTARDCFASASIPSPDVHIFVFDVQKNRKMLSLLRSMDGMDWSDDSSSATMTRFLAKYDSVMKLVEHGHRLATATSDSQGNFALAITPTEGVIVFGYNEPEDAPVYYAYRVLHGRRSGSFILDMSHGECARAGILPTTTSPRLSAPP